MPERKQSVEAGNGRDTGRSGGEVTPPGGGIIGVILTPVTMIAAGIASMVSALWNDRELAAFGRQGIDELGAALKPFPDSIQVQETGTIWNPTQAEVTNSGNLGGHRRSSYSSLTPPRGWSAEEENGQRRDNGQEKSNGQDQGMSM
jgi:hypothetical protein